MRKENQVCSLEQSKVLKQLGVVQDCYWQFWIKDNEGQDIELERFSYLGQGFYKEAYAAFTVAELGVMIGKFSEMPYKSTKGYWVIFTDKFERHPTEAQARAALVIDSIQRKIRAFKVEYINKRLLAA